MLSKPEGTSDSSTEKTENGSSGGFSHVDAAGRARMVDVGDKAMSRRSATASSRIRMSLQAAHAIRSNQIAKGDVLAVARIAAIQGTKHTSLLIPLCHPLWVDGVEVSEEWINETTLAWTVTVRTTGKTGVEMEALTGASVAALTVYDMCKSIDRTMEIESIRLETKTGGIHGDYVRNEPLT